MIPLARRLARFNSNFQVPFWLAVELGAVAGIRVQDKFGLNLDIDSGPEDIWTLGGVYTGQPTTGTQETLSVISSSSVDTLAGTGARIVTIQGLDGNYDEISEAIQLSGTSSATTTQEFWRVNRAFVETAGSGQTNAGDITIRMSSTTANIMASIPAGAAQTQQSNYTVSRNHTAYIFNFQLELVRASGAAGSGQVSFRIRDTVNNVFRARRLYAVSDSLKIDTELDLPISERSDIIIRADSVSDTNTQIVAEYQFFLIKDKEDG